MPDTLAFATSSPSIYYPDLAARPAPPKPATVAPIDAITDATRVAIGRRGQRATITTWGEFWKDNPDIGSRELRTISATVRRGEVYLGGGGAEGEWTIFREEMIEPHRHYDGSDIEFDPVKAGAVTAEQLASFRAYRETEKKGRPTGAADFADLHTRVVLNYVNVFDVIKPNSVRYWWLITFYEANWTAKREGGTRWVGRWQTDADGQRWRPCSHWPARSKLLPHEKAAEDLLAVCEEINATGSAYFDTHASAHNRVMARQSRDWHTLALGQAVSYAERRRMLLAWRVARRPLWAKFHAAIAGYQRLRAELAEEA